MDLNYPIGATPLDPDETAGLLLSHITTREELNHWEQMNIGEAEEWAFNRKHKDLLSQSFICRLHKKMFGSIWAWAGQFRKSMKNLGVQPWQIAVEVTSFVRTLQSGLNQQRMNLMKYVSGFTINWSGYIPLQMEMAGMLASWPISSQSRFLTTSRSHGAEQTSWGPEKAEQHT